ncbi:MULTISPECIES: ABC transporter ATP-binding protein [unclassified Mesorhizobium]|uniref:ABC transporter ATP-binding protein n=1 Tax=unclassified Mesorhizobium TaxID=325217 RepID=UPI0011264072|nr:MULTISPECIES: ABC transporter ATP-binding protein [unclassified Mesorhizobium]TPK51708.1 ABC transporter ATP-binding protein [Mesorhizobium sp. B2-5-2]TPL15565.1 ABC transporter ATP-binding protein [Mesorhizobium sp. B2-4-9]TPL30666.1 ABC transporter ATP-binding protein [Mesorhizobium sp. B2-4-7]TPL44984.1 ABC transporter ATP-binding protein [Mesorhizobium sp. B2-4-5]TPM76404.1 ABC transporter ATP-binding protein [Mesorhizobium sp. B2-1-6]
MSGVLPDPVLSIRDLRIGVGKRNEILHGVSFDILPGETYGLVGESGSGKSITGLSVMGLLKRPLEVTGGSIFFRSQDVLKLGSRARRRLRGDRMAMVFQEPMTALNPLMAIGRQIAEMFVVHRGFGWSDAGRKAVEALESVRVPAPEERALSYPHQLSGGMRQRVMVAIALACRPDLLIADEPTTALDVTVQAGVLELLAELCTAEGTAVLLVSHDLGVIANMCRRVGVMDRGRLVEEQDTKALFENPLHPYTRGLLAARPRLGSRTLVGRARLTELDQVVGSEERGRDAPTLTTPRGLGLEATA